MKDIHRQETLKSSKIAEWTDERLRRISAKREVLLITDLLACSRLSEVGREKKGEREKK